MRTQTCIISLAFFLMSGTSYSQSNLDSVFIKMNPQQWANSVAQKTARIADKMMEKAHLSLRRLQKHEKKIYRRMLKDKDSAMARDKLKEINEKYAVQQLNLSRPVSSSFYHATLDTAATAIKFLQEHGLLIKDSGAIIKVRELQQQLTKTANIRTFMYERREELKAQLQQWGKLGQLKKINKEVYYYSTRFQEYKSLISDKKKRERKAIELLSKSEAFKNFMRKNSQLASLFRMPGDPSNPASLAGLQTRVQVNNLIQQQITAAGSGGMQQFQQNVQQAQSQFQQLKNKVSSFGGGSSDDIMPEGFKPNRQKTKSFWRHLEYGTNIQTVSSNRWFPVTSDLGLSVGYKLNDKSIIGIGGSYKMGWGRSIRNIDITHQGLGLRSFLDIKLKKSFWLTGGYEQNYRAAFDDFSQLQDRSGWQQSGLLGLSKVVSLKTKFSKKTKLQLLWDFLSYQQIPRTQPVVVRVGYSF